MRWILVAALVLLAACAAPTPAPPPALHTDAGPVTRWFPLVGDPIAVWWVEERLGSGDAPGPNDYRRTAVIHLTADVAGEMEALIGADPAPTPDLPPVLLPYAPGGPLRTGRELDERLAPAGTSTRAWLEPAADIVVLVSTTT